MLELSAREDLARPLAGRGVALVFQKPSARTRSSMEMAVVGLGGHPVYIQDHEVGLGSRETPEDVARTLACFHTVIAARVRDHAVLEQMAAATAAPVLNLLSDKAHPLQALADLLTIRELVGAFSGLRVAYVGDANNVSRSLAEACARMGLRLTLAAPEGYQFDLGEIAALNRFAGEIRQVGDPAEAVRGARVVCTDVWTSMGQESESAERLRAFDGFQVNAELMAKADDAWFLHCLPAHRGEEVAAEVIDGPRSAVWRQAHNRMRTARGALAWMLRT